MLTIRMQRTGRKGHAMFRIIVQDARRTPTSGKIVAAIGNYDPHIKTGNVDKEKAKFYMEHGAKPSDRVARFLKNEGVSLPSWVSLEAKGDRSIRNPEKLRRNRPTGAEAPKPEIKVDDGTKDLAEEVNETSAKQTDQPSAEEETTPPEKPTANEDPSPTGSIPDQDNKETKKKDGSNEAASESTIEPTD